MRNISYRQTDKHFITITMKVKLSLFLKKKAPPNIFRGGAGYY